MTVRLAGGVVAGRGLRVWAPGPAGVPVDAADPPHLPPGAAVALGPEDAGEADVRLAVAELAALVSVGGLVAAGAGVDLGADFRSARLEGARGDRRDAVLAALAVSAPDAAHRVGARAAVLVALFGPAATRPVGAAAGAAIRDGRWAALRLASAASDVLGPEQLERVLALDAPDGVDPFGRGAPSTVAEHLGQILATVPGPRRLGLLLDLWDQVCAHQARARRRERLRASQGRHDRVEDLRRRYRHFDDELVLRQVRRELGSEPSLAEAARWVSDRWFWLGCLNRVLQDALAATVLMRTAVAVSDHGVADGVARSSALIALAAALLDDDAARDAARRVPGLPGLPARPGCYVRNLDAWQRRGTPLDDKAVAYVTQRLVRARDYGTVVSDAVAELVSDMMDVSLEPPHRGALRDWADRSLEDWRAVAGYSAARPPDDWQQPPLSADAAGQRRPNLAQRLQNRPDVQAAEVETVGDLLWYADLADALAELGGHDAAVVYYGRGLPGVDVGPAHPEPVPLGGQLDSVPLAVSGAAQLVSSGGEVPRRCRTWTELVDGLRSDAAVAEALTGRFPVPAPVAAVDGAIVPGTAVRVEVARDPRALADWAGYMGNCIAGLHYREQAGQGRCALAALRDRDGRILANLELRPSRPVGHGWQVAEFRTRFNEEPDPDLAERVRRWVATIPPVTTGVTVTPPRPARPSRRPGRRVTSRVLGEVGERLSELAEQALATDDAMRAATVLTLLARRLGSRLRDADGSPSALPPALTTLRRATPARLAQVCREALRDGPRGADPEAPGLTDLWAASGAAPLAEALSRLDPALWERFDRLDALLNDAPLPGSLRTLARRPGVAPARSMTLVTRRLRAAIGRLARDGDPVLAESVAREPGTDLLCALVLAVSSWAGEVDASAAGSALPPLTSVAAAGVLGVPGFPPSSLANEDGPWRRAWPAACELGATDGWDGTVARGLFVPTAWLGPGGWPALWSRAARHPTIRA